MITNFRTHYLIKNEKKRKQIAIVGGSTAFGVGASNNSKTLSSCLAQLLTMMFLI